MDTGSESFLSTQDTPNSVLSSDFDDKDQSASDTDKDAILRLQNPKTQAENAVLRLSDPQKSKNDLNDSFLNKMSLLRLDSVEDTVKNRPKNLGISPPKFSSALTLTTDHPLMGLGSPDSIENYPDVVPKKMKTLLDDPKDLSLSSIEDEKNTNETNSFTDFYTPQRNTSKNNLYFNDNFTTADSQEISRIDNLNSQPDVARVHNMVEKDSGRRKIVPMFRETELKSNITSTSTPQRVLGRIIDGNRDESAILKYVEERKKKLSGSGDGTMDNSDIPLRNSESVVNRSSESSGARGFSIPLSVNEDFNTTVRTVLTGSIVLCSTYLVRKSNSMTA